MADTITVNLQLARVATVEVYVDNSKNKQYWVSVNGKGLANVGDDAYDAVSACGETLFEELEKAEARPAKSKSKRRARR